MSTLYVPNGDPACFPRSAVAESRGEISIDQYLENVLPHLSGITHPEAECSTKRINFHPLSMSIQSCLFERDFTILEDTSNIEKLLSHCWKGELENVRSDAPQALDVLEAHGISKNIFEAMLCIACERTDIALLQYCLTLDYNSYEIISRSPPNSIWNATTRSPSLDIWRLLIENGLLDQQESVRQNILISLAGKGLKADIPHIELLQDLFRHGLVTSESLLCWVAQGADIDTTRYMLSKYERTDLERSNALIVASCSNERVIDLLLESGMNINAEGGGDEDPFANRASSSPLHAAAGEGNMAAVKMLLDRGALKTKRDSHIKSAAERAVENGHPEIADFIQSYEDWKTV